jgi:hypothetical protein
MQRLPRWQRRAERGRPIPRDFRGCHANSGKPRGSNLARWSGRPNPLRHLAVEGVQRADGLLQIALALTSQRRPDRTVEHSILKLPLQANTIDHACHPGLVRRLQFRPHGPAIRSSRTPHITHGTNNFQLDCAIGCADPVWRSAATMGTLRDTSPAEGSLHAVA